MWGWGGGGGTDTCSTANYVRLHAINKKYKLFDATKFILILPTFRLIHSLICSLKACKEVWSKTCQHIEFRKEDCMKE